MTDAVLDVQNLRVEFSTSRGTVPAVRGVSLRLRPGESLGLVGESGSGKSMTALALMRLLPSQARLSADRLTIAGQDVLGLSEHAINRIRGRHISIILQDPMSSLNPSFTIGSQIAEALALHQNLRGAEMRRRVIDILAKVGIAEPERRRHDFPHQLSGGMRQRVVSAIALSCQPDVLLADEPTTSLDPTIRVQFLRLLKTLQAELGFAMIFISHDMATVARVCDRIAVMYAGLVVEHAPVAAFLRAPVHPYSRALVAIMESARIGGARLERIEGSPPDPRSLPPGCAFAPRCGFAMDRCRVEAPPETSVGPGQHVHCWLAEQRP